MAVLASSIINRVRTQVIDNGSTQRWTDAELLGWLSDGQRAVVAVVPSAYVTNANVALVAGTRQSVPSTGWKLVEIYRNTSGQACFMIPRSVLDMQYPTWHVDTATSNITHWVYDENEPQAFYVYPPNTGAGSVNMTYSVMPTDLASISSNLTIRDQYQTPLFDYVMFRAHSKDSDYAAGQQLAGAYWQSFQNGLAPFAGRSG
jgi:hypothetical protein